MKSRCPTVPFVALGVALTGFLSLSPSVSHAADWFRAGATMCTPNDGYMAGNSAGDAYKESGFLNSASLTCPLYEREGLSRLSLDEIKVFAHDASHSQDVAVQLCRRSYTGAAATCGAASSSGDGYVGSVSFDQTQLDTVPWFFSAGFAYFDIFLGNQSAFRGYYIKND